jgi:HK97 family phage portal protein
MAATDYLDNLEAGVPNTWGERQRKFNVRNAYRVVSWVYSCVNCIAACISGTPFYFYTDGDEGERIPLPPNHPAEQLFKVPYPGRIPSRSEMIRIQIVNHELFGESFMRIVSGGKGRGSRPTVQLMSAYSMTHTMNQKTGEVAFWEFKNPNTSNPPERITPSGLTQWKYPNPYDDIRGLAPLTATRLAIEQDINMSVWNAGFFMSGLKNPLALLVKQTLDPRQRKQFIDGILQSFSGFYKGQMPLLLEGGTDVKVLANTMKDLDFIEGKQLTREEILTVYGIPPAQVGIFRYANYASAKEQRVLLYTNNAKPKMIYYRDVFQHNILDTFWPGVKCDWDWQSIDVLRDDPKITSEAARATAEAAKIYFEMGYDRTEIALILKNPDLDPDVSDGTNRPDGGLAAVMEAEAEAKEPPDTEDTADESSEDVSSKDEQPAKKMVRLLPFFVKTTQNKDSIIQHIPDGATKAYAKETNDQLVVVKSVLDAYFRTFIDQASVTMVKKELNEAFWLLNWNKMFQKALRNIYWAGAKSALTNLGKFAMPDGTLGKVARIKVTASDIPLLPTDLEEGLTPDLQIVQERSEEMAVKIIRMLNDIRLNSNPAEHARLIKLVAAKVDLLKIISFAYNRARYQTFVGAGVSTKVWGSQNGNNGKEAAMEKLIAGQLFPGQKEDTVGDVILPKRVAKDRVADFREMA